jgi:N-acetylated-alpha-linked acidic dipeptidase
VRLKLEFDWKTVQCRDVIAVLKGNELPDQWVIRGNHHDAWVMGADDPISGAVALMEEARCVGELAKSGWRPKRTMIYCLWDGEEPGLLGSTEWVEKHADELSEKAVLYLNTDSTGRGYLGMGGSHTLEPLLNDIAREVKDPETGLTLFGRMKARAVVGGDKEAKSKADMPIGALGSGSDYTPFLQHIGVASLNLGMGGEDEGGVYHSTYDSFDHYSRFGDPD